MESSMSNASDHVISVGLNPYFLKYKISKIIDERDDFDGFLVAPFDFLSKQNFLNVFSEESYFTIHFTPQSNSRHFIGVSTNLIIGEPSEYSRFRSKLEEHLAILGVFGN